MSWSLGGSELLEAVVRGAGGSCGFINEGVIAIIDFQKTAVLIKCKKTDKRYF